MEDLKSYETRVIEINEVDDMGEYFFHHLLNRFAQIATESAMKLGVWNYDMMSKYGWVVAKQYLHLDEPIHYQDRIELSTTISKGTYVNFPRYYYIKKDNRLIGTCSSVWTLLDIQKEEWFHHKNRDYLSRSAFGAFIRITTSYSKDMEFQYMTERKVLYSDVDINQHMNNTRYVEWALDLIDFDKHHQCYISDLNIQYRKEIRPLEKVKLFMAEDGHRYIVEGRSQEDEVYFTIEIYFRDR